MRPLEDEEEEGQTFRGLPGEEEEEDPEVRARKQQWQMPITDETRVVPLFFSSTTRAAPRDPRPYREEHAARGGAASPPKPELFSLPQFAYDPKLEVQLTYAQQQLYAQLRRGQGLADDRAGAGRAFGGEDGTAAAGEGGANGGGGPGAVGLLGPGAGRIGSSMDAATNQVKMAAYGALSRIKEPEESEDWAYLHLPMCKQSSSTEWSRHKFSLQKLREEAKQGKGPRLGYPVHRRRDDLYLPLREVGIPGLGYGIRGYAVALLANTVWSVCFVRSGARRAVPLLVGAAEGGGLRGGVQHGT